MMAASSQGTEEGLEETGGGELAELDDQPGLACDQIKVGQAHPLL
jgi:hypothetical protein